jgi:DNA-binding NarL/FixJ family response regulator
MDLRLADGSGVDACREILAALPQTRVLFLTSYHDDEAVLSAIFAGAQGYLLKEVGADVLIDAVKTVAAGRSILDPLATKIVLERMRSLSSIVPSGAEGQRLSEQEQRVLALVAEGKTNKEIAAALDLSEKTVKNYLSNIFQKLHITRRTQAASLYSREPGR